MHPSTSAYSVYVIAGVNIVMELCNLSPLHVETHENKDNPHHACGATCQTGMVCKLHGKALFQVESDPEVCTAHFTIDSSEGRKIASNGSATKA